MWASKYLKEKKRGQNTPPQRLLESIQSKIKTLKELYTEDAIRGFDDDQLAWILFVDGCAVLQFMNNVSQKKRDEVEALDIFVQHDLLLLENQLPYQVLKMLSNEDDAMLRSYIKSFLEKHHMIIPDQHKDSHQPTHILDLLRTTILPKEHKVDMPPPAGSNKAGSNKENDGLITHRNIQELRTSGIGIKPNGPRESLTSIKFSGSKLYLSQLTLDDFTAQTFLNMIAYEMCPDFKNKYEISNYVFFLNSLIDHEDDVKVLRKAGVLHNFLGSDQEVANIFNTVSTDLVLDTGIYQQVRLDIEMHYKSKRMTWLTEFRRKHFNSPWAFIGLLSTILGITLTVISLISAIKKH